MQQLKDALTKIKHSWVNLAIGIFLIVAGVASVFVSPCSEQIASNWKEVKWVIMIGIAICFLPQIGNKGKKAGVMLFPLFLLGSCVTYDKCVDKYGEVDETVTVDTVMQTETVFDTVIKTDSVTVKEYAYKIPDTPTTVQREGSRAKITYWKDKYSHLLHMRAECDSIVIRDTVQVTDTVTIDCPPVTQLTEDLAWYEKAWQSIKDFAAIGFFVLLLAIAILKKLK